MTNTCPRWMAVALMLASGASLGCGDDSEAAPPTVLCPRGQVAVGTSCSWFALDGFDSEDVSFKGHGNFMLEGDITIPQASNATQFPAVLLLHDRGPQDRHGSARGQHQVDFMKTIPVFDDLRDHLAAAGFVVLRYDNRLCFPVTGCDNNYPTSFTGLVYDDIVGDADAAAAYLATHPSVLADDITIIGHGDGGQVATAITTPLRDLVMFGGSYEPVDINLVAQLMTTVMVLEDAGLSSNEIDMATMDEQQVLKDLDDIRKGTFNGDDIGGQSEQFWTQWLAVGDAAGDRLPLASYGVLQLHGTYDWNVLEATVTAFSNKMASSHPDTSYKLFPQLTHPMVRVVEPDLANVGPSDVASSLDGLLLNELGGWLFRGTDGEGPPASE